MKTRGLSPFSSFDELSWILLEAKQSTLIDEGTG